MTIYIGGEINMDTSRVSGIARAKIFSEAGFDDKNNNGIIEKRVKGAVMAEEGYNEEADINLDGKITVPEAKLYLRQLFCNRPEIKQIYPITRSDQTVLLGLFREALEAARIIKEPLEKAHRLRYLVSSMADAGLFKESLAVARAIEDLVTRSDALRGIARRMAFAGLFREALEVARTMGDSRFKSYALLNIAKVMAKAGKSEKEIKKMFNETGNEIPKE
jgi:hypothetical protein